MRHALFVLTATLLAPAGDADHGDGGTMKMKVDAKRVGDCNASQS